MFSDIPDFDYKKAYEEIREVFDGSCVRKALLFAAKNPEIVYGRDTDEYTAVVHGGYFNLYSRIANSNSLSERT